MSLLDALVEALALKEVDREGWNRIGVDGPESVAAHSWGVAWLVLLLLPEELDRGKALAYATLHDLAEVRTGDITPHDAIEPAEKHALEDQAMRDLLAGVPRGAELLASWRAYEAQADPEARFVRQLDRLDMAIQAERYRRGGATSTAQFITSAARVVQHPTVAAILDLIRQSGTQEPTAGPKADDQ